MNPIHADLTETIPCPFTCPGVLGRAQVSMAKGTQDDSLIAQDSLIVQVTGTYCTAILSGATISYSKNSYGGQNSSGNILKQESSFED